MVFFEISIDLIVTETMTFIANIGMRLPDYSFSPYKRWFPYNGRMFLLYNV